MVMEKLKRSKYINLSLKKGAYNNASFMIKYKINESPTMASGHSRSEVKNMEATNPD